MRCHDVVISAVSGPDSLKDHLVKGTQTSLLSSIPRPFGCDSNHEKRILRQDTKKMVSFSLSTIVTAQLPAFLNFVIKKYNYLQIAYNLHVYELVQS